MGGRGLPLRLPRGARTVAPAGGPLTATRGSAPRLLHVCTAFPPAVGGGAARNLLTSRGLASRGWLVTVLTGDRRSPQWSDETPLGSLPKTVQVVRAHAPDLTALGRRRGVIGVPSRPDRRTGIRSWLRGIALTWLLIPDADAFWIPFAVATGRRLLADERYDAMITSGPPHSAHIAGRLIRRRGLRWIVDSQDPWADHPFPSMSSRVRHGIDRWLERSVFGAADAVVAATESQTSRFRASHGGSAARWLTLPGGYDEAEFEGVVPERPEGRRILHVGSFYGARSPGGFLAALRSLAHNDPSLLAEVEVMLAGYADPTNRRVISEAMSDPLLERIVQYVPHVNRRRSLSLMAGSDVLLLVTDPLGGGRDLVPLKTFEYLRTGRPILAIAPEGETARLLRRTGGAVIAHPDDVGAIESGLKRVLAGIAPADPTGVRELSFDRTLDRLDVLLRS